MHLLLMGRSGPRWLGGSQYIKNLAKAIRCLPVEERADVRVTVGVYAESGLAIYGDIRDKVDALVNLEAVMPRPTLANRLRWRFYRGTTHSLNPRFEEWLVREGVDFAYPARPRVSWTRRVRFADWIPDFQYDHFPAGSNPEEIAARKRDNAVVTAQAPKIVLSSKATEADCHRLFPKSVGKTFVYRFRVAPPAPASGDPTTVARAYHLPERFFLVSNLFAPTKNHAVVFRAVSRLAARGLHVTVACTGDIHDYRNPSFASETLTAINRLGVSDRVRLLGVIPKADQLTLLRQAVAVIQPSLFEGWNTSVEEARALGLPLLVSDIPVHREQDVPWARYFAPEDADGLTALMERAWNAPRDIRPEAEARDKYLALTQDAARSFLAFCRECCR